MQRAIRRAHLIDQIRGWLIIYIVIYHLLYDLTALFGVGLPFFWRGWFQAVRVGAVMALLVISGMVSECTRSGLKRALKLSLCAGAITLVSFIALPDAPIYFGVLHLYAACTLFYHAVGRYIKAPAPWIGALICLCGFVLFYHMGEGFLGFGPLRIALPGSLYKTGWLAPLGFPPPRFVSSDYYPFLPWVWMFMAGVCYAEPLAAGRLPGWVYKPTRLPLIEKIGRRTLLIYMVHQPILIVLLFLYFRLVGM